MVERANDARPDRTASADPRPDAPTAPDRETPTREAPTTDEERIDESIDESFPASDPPAVHPSERR